MWPTSRLLRLARSARLLPRARLCRRPAFKRPLLELLEDRSLPSGYAVTTTADTGPGSLRDAINQVNADTSHTLYASPSNSSVDEIDFAITAGSDTGGGFHPATGVASIAPQSGLPSVTNAVTIDGWSQPGFSGTPLIELNGTGAGNVNGLSILAADTTVRGLVINHFGGYAIAFYQAPHAWVCGSYIGLDPTGKVGEGNGGGVSIGASDHVIIGTNADGVNDGLERNLISGTPGYPGDGIFISGCNDVTIQGNYLGTDVTGNVAIANAGNDIYAEGTNSQLQIIGNLISGNGSDTGIGLVNTVSLSAVVIQGNRLGTNAAGTAALGNGTGIFMDSAVQNVTIGGTGAGMGNLISGNHNGALIFATNVTVQGNLVGTDVTGAHAIPNDVGLGLYGSNILVGGTVSGAGNVISGNRGSGIDLQQTPTTGPIQIQGNRIGTDLSGGYAIGNGGDGISLAANNVTVGGTTPAARNLISGNGNGVHVGGTGNVVEGNYVGTDVSGTKAVPNGTGGATAGILLGGTSATVVGNLVSGNNGAGILLWNTSGDTVESNVIGTDVTGSVALPNQEPGVFLFQNAKANQIGAPGAGNLVSGNNSYGIWIDYSDVQNNVVQANRIGTNAAGTAALANTSTGIVVGASNNTVGGSAAGQGNVISGNRGDGIDLYATGNVIRGNAIGTDVSGSLHLGNGFVGVSVDQASSDSIGGTGAGDGNTIANNGSAGIRLYSASTVAILGNSIHDNGGLGIDLGNQGGNNSQAAPALTSALSGLGITVLTGTITSAASATVRVEFFANTPGDAEGRTLVGSAAVATDSSGHGSFTTVLSTVVPAGQGLVTATVTDPSGNTSEFSAGVLATPLPPASLSGLVWEDFNNDGQVDFGEKGISGVTITLTGTDFIGRSVSLSQQTDSDGAYVFLNLLPGNYYITETQPAGYLQGIDSVGTAAGSLSATDQFFVSLGLGVDGLNYNYGEQPTGGGSVQPGQTAGIGFWNNKHGQALIKALNGGTGHELADWLAATLPNTFGAHAASNNLAGKSNAAVAALFQSDFVMKGVKLDAQALATALSVYATNATLDPTQVAATYGFTVSGNGAGTSTISVGSNGDAFGVSNNTTLTLMDLLLATDAQAVNGVLYNGNTTKRNEANNIFSAVNEGGSIS
jgi:parallel beta-helix repeat protein